MAGSKFNKAFGTLGKLGGIGAAWAGSYLGVPQANSNKEYLGRAGAAANYRFGSSDIAGLMSQIEHAPTLQNIEGTDLYNPSFNDAFRSMAGAGMASFGASKFLTDGLNWKKEDPFKNTPSIKHQTFGSVQDQATSDFLSQNPEDMTDEEYKAWAEQNGIALPEGFSCGGHLHGCGGHKLAGGGWADAMGELKDQMSWDWGKAANMGLNLASAGIGIGLNYLGMRNQMDQADLEAKEVNAANAYARQLMAHNLGQAVNDTKNNMFNQQALQMMAMGGDLQSHGGNFPMSGFFNIIGAGGTHEQNPIGGVYQGMAEDGKPNLVEQDEVVWNDYVFSNRLTIPDEYAKEHKIKKGSTYAEAAKYLSKESEERPDDPISQNTLNDLLGDLRESQETLRAEQEAARIKKEISKMTPEEVSQMMSFLSGGQQGYANGGYLGMDANFFKKGGEEEKAAAAKTARDKGLYASAIGNLTPGWLQFLANSFGFDPNYNQSDIDEARKKFLLENYDRVGGFEGLNSKYAEGNRMPLLGALPDYNITETQSYSMTPEQWRQFFAGMDAYKESLKPSATENKYHADPNFIYNGRRVGKGLSASEDVEQDPRYKDFKNYVLQQAQKYEQGDESADPYVMEYLQTLDRGINTDKGVQKLLQYDANGKVKTDENGRMLFNKDIDWAKEFRDRSFDQIGGIYHYYNDVPETQTNRAGERWIVRLNGKNIAVNGRTKEELEAEMAKNPRFRKAAQNDADEWEDLEGGGRGVTHYLNYESPSFEANYTPETEGEIPPVEKLPTFMRHAPLLGDLAALQGPAKDYSTNVMPQNAIYAPIGDYLAYNPVDTQRYLNAENQQAAAQLNTIMNASAGNRNMAMAQAALANQQRQQGIGQRMQAAEQINWDRLGRVGEFNRGTNMFNAQAHNQAELANMQNNHLLMNQAQRNAAMRHAVDSERDAAISQNLSTLLDNLGAIGRENFAFNQANANRALDFWSDLNGNSYFRPSTLGSEEKVILGAHGGYLTRKNRR